MINYIEVTWLSQLVGLGLVVVLTAGLISWAISIAIRTFVQLLKGR